MDVHRLLESIKKMMRTILDPLSDNDRNCAYAAVRSLIFDLEEHVREEKNSDAHLLEKLKKLRYHLRVIADFEERGDYLEIHHYKFALDIIGDLQRNPEFKSKKPTQEALPPLLPKWK
jgi:hypothetical protein